MLVNNSNELLTINNKAMTLKETIKQLASEQPSLKNQRKTVKIVGENTMDAYKALNTHLDNRQELRHLYIAYGKLRGVPHTDSGNGLLYHDRIDDIVKEHKEEFVCKAD